MAAAPRFDAVARFNTIRVSVAVPTMVAAATMATWGVTEWAASERQKNGRVPWYVVIVGSAGIITAGVIGSRVGAYVGRKIAVRTM